MESSVIKILNKCSDANLHLDDITLDRISSCVKDVDRLLKLSLSKMVVLMIITLNFEIYLYLKIKGARKNENRYYWLWTRW